MRVAVTRIKHVTAPLSCNILIVAVLRTIIKIIENKQSFLSFSLKHFLNHVLKFCYF